MKEILKELNEDEVPTPFEKKHFTVGTGPEVGTVDTRDVVRHKWSHSQQGT